MKKPDVTAENRIREAFREKTGYEPDGLWQAPGRVNLIGEHVDYNQGFVLPIAIDRRTLAAGRARDDELLRVWSLQFDGEPSSANLRELEPGKAGDWTAYVAGTAWALEQVVGPLQGADLVVHSDVPVGAGLSSSAALEIASGIALANLSGIDIDLQDLALAAQRAENDFVGVPCGIMDQLVSAAGRAEHALLIDTLTLQVRYIPFQPERFGAVLVVIDTRTSHHLADGEYAIRRRSCEEAAEILGVASLRNVQNEDLKKVLSRLPERLRPFVRHVVTENQRVQKTAVAFEQGDLQRAGRYMNASHGSLKDDYGVSSPELDLAVDVAFDSGAYGARMTGGGFGGSVIALIPSTEIASLKEKIKRAFASQSMRPPAFFEVKAASGCSRL